jgi:hypothetical protein
LHPTLERIDRVFISTEWDALFIDHNLQSLSSLCSDHSPLLPRTEDNMQAKKRFHFSCFWPHFPGFQEVVAQASLCPLGNVSSLARFDWVLRNTARFLRSRIDHSIGNIRMQLEIAKEVVLHLEVARDHRQLHAHEEYLRHQAKLKSLALSSLQCTIAHQESHIQWLSKGDAPP